MGLLCFGVASTVASHQELWLLLGWCLHNLSMVAWILSSFLLHAGLTSGSVLIVVVCVSMHGCLSHLSLCAPLMDW